MVSSVEEARAHISRIRKSRGLDVDDGGGDNINAEDLHAALDMLSEQLYRSPTRFIMELIQNADDNSYADRVPELSISLSGRHLHIACNEVGFEERNVDAICRINNSTKTSNKSGDGYVGEKGIGFKSVFKVADVVWISSGYYTFKFDKRAGLLGMVAPIWAEFPCGTVPGYTEFFLQLSETTDINGIKEELMALQPSLLLFLRRLRRINISVPGGSGNVSLTCTPNSGVRILSRNGFATDYIVHNYVIPDMPPEERRPGVSRSRITLAFPMGTDGKPVLNEQDVFAFLPIRSYGFKFLIQADFLLVASREDIDQSKDWNKRVLKGIANAFIGFVCSQRHDSLKYQWPRFIPREIHPGTFLKPLENYITQSLREHKILLSSDGTFEKPANLRCTQSPFLDTTGSHMFSYGNAPYKPLCLRYPRASVEHIKLLGVKTETFAEFLERLVDLIRYNNQTFRNMPKDWHARLAKIICSECGSRLPQPLLYEEIIPLTSGEWVASKGNGIFFEKTRSDLVIPDGLNILTVDPRASTDPSRRALFEALGVKECDAVEICDAIRAKHVEIYQHHGLHTSFVSMFVQQVKFLFCTRTQSFSRYGQLESDIWLADSNGSIAHGCDLYLDDPDIFPLRACFGKYSSARFLHPAFIEAVPLPQRRAWFSWLQQTFAVSSIPRITAAPYSPSPTPEFQHIITALPPLAVLELIRDHWQSYSTAFSTFSENSVWDRIRSLNVPCRDGIVRPLHETYLPLTDLTSKMPTLHSVPLLRISDASDHRWMEFRVFGVGTSDSLLFYIDCLKGLKFHASEDFRYSMIKDLYRIIQDRCYEDVELVRGNFLKHSLVYLPLNDVNRAGDWSTSGDCVWAAPECLEGIHPLRQFYRGYKKLFKEVLRIRDADIGDVVQELIYSQGTVDFSDTIKALLVQLNSYIKRGKRHPSLEHLKNLAIFPIRHLDGTSTSLASGSNPCWYIADWSYLETSFKGEIDLVDFRPEICRELYHLFEALGMSCKFLSKAMRQRARYEGDVVPNHVLTSKLEEKAVHLLRLTPLAQRETVANKLLAAEVFEVTAINVERFVEAHSQTIHGKSASGDIVFEWPDADGRGHIPTIYISVEGLKSEKFPPYQLSTELCRLCQIDEKHERTVDFILRWEDHNAIGELLDKQGVGFDRSTTNDDEDEDDEDSNDYEKLEGTGVIFKAPKQQKITGGRNGGLTAIDNMLTSLASAYPSSLPQVGLSGSFKRKTRKNATYKDVTETWKMSLTQARSPAQYEQDMQVGFEGEFWVYNYIRGLDANLPTSIWTSAARERAGLDHFTGNEADYTDFTVFDKDSRLLEPIFGRNITTAPDPITYHVEVKSTTGPCAKPFFLSHNQLQRARNLTFEADGPLPSQIYVIARVSNIGSEEPQCMFFVDPWRMYVQGHLELKPPQSHYIVSTQM